jgi:signal transduction histidine kinase
MGSRGRSIRLRIYFLVAIPLAALVGLLAYVGGTSINNAINLDRAPNLINATSLPTANFVKLLQAERAAAVVYLFHPTADNLSAFNAAAHATDADKPKFLAAMNSPGTKGSETAEEARGIQAMEAGLSQLPRLREGVMARALTPLQALGAYTEGIANEPKLFLEEANSLTNASAANQALGLIATVSAREALSQEHALLSGMLAGRRITQADRAAFAQMVATRQGDLVDAEAILDAKNKALFNAQINNGQQSQLAQIEGAVSIGSSVARLPVTLTQWQGLAGQLLDQYFAGGVNVAGNQLVADRNMSNSAKVRVAVTAGLGLAGLLITIVVSILVGRGIIRRLGGLESTALQLAEVQLPDVVGRLRRGEDVDVASEAPPLRVGQDEIGRVGQAFDLVRQTAIRAAVEEARLRRGLNDVFRSLARRSQSLLHRQLTLLDQMERRASDPEALDDLFRLDHLTTRMRRHAEGLVILAGAPPGRGWSNPVRMVDVMRGAIAEVEDYARVSVATRSQAALSGSAVADVIHLLAELIENATTLSPPYTSVRVAGETVASGFAIEVEDRGLGMSPQRLAELNERLARPPEFNPSDSEQLGLFVVGQLGKRHGIRVTLKASPYGGTSAIVLIPQHLVVNEEAVRAGLPGQPAAIVMTPGPANGSNGVTRPIEPPGLPQQRGPGQGEVPGGRVPGPPRQPQGSDDLPRRRHNDPSPGAMPGGAVPFAPGGAVPFAAGDAGPMVPGGAVPFASGGAGPMVPGGAGHADFDVFAPRRPGSPPLPAAGPAPYSGSAAGSYPGTGTAPYSNQPAPFPAWTRDHPAGTSPAGPAGPVGAAGPGGAGGAGGTATPMTPVASPSPKVSGPPWELSRQAGPLPGMPAGSDPSSAATPGGNGEHQGLPRRVKQANLAPQLRADPPHLRTSTGGGMSGGPSPAEIRKTMSALQRGWQEGRSQQATGSSAPEPGPTDAQGPSADSISAAPGPSGPAPDAPGSPGPDTTAPDSTAD